MIHSFHKRAALRSLPLLLVAVLFFLLPACRQSNPPENKNAFAPVIREAHGHVIPADSVAAPKVTMVDASKLKRVEVTGNKISPLRINTDRAMAPRIINAGTPRRIHPGEADVPGPGIQTCIPASVPAGTPEVTLAKDAYTKEQNPQNFSSYSKLQGLKHGNINCMMEDKAGNLWLGTWGGGMSRFDGKYFTHYTENEGMPSNDIRSMLQDEKGTIWLATYGGGLCCFDGKVFSCYTTKEGLCSNELTSLIKDKNNNLWFGSTGGGISKFDGKVFTHYTSKNGLTKDSITSAYCDAGNQLWFGSQGGGISKFDGEQFITYTMSEGLPHNDVYGITQDSLGNMWFATAGGISCFNGKTFTNYTTAQGLSNNFVRTAYRDHTGILWFGTWGGGVNRFDGTSFFRFTETDGLSNNSVQCIQEDTWGNLWFGTWGGGVSKYDGKQFTHLTQNDGLSINDVYGITQDSTGQIWLSTYGGGINRYDGTSFTHFTEKEGISNYAYTCLKDKAGNLWFGTDGKGICKFDGRFITNYTRSNGLCNDFIYSSLVDRNGNLWFGTNGGGVSKFDGNSFTGYDTTQGLANNTVLCITEDADGNIWFGTWGGGVSKFDGKQFTTYSESGGLSSNIVISALCDKSGHLWFGTYGNGACRFDGKSFTSFTEKEGLSNNVVMSILEDRYGSLWFGTRFGLSRMTREKQELLQRKVTTGSWSESDVLFKNFTYSDGFLGIGCNSNAMYEDNHGTLWIGANDRLTAFHSPQAGDITDTIPPNIQVTGLELFNEPIQWSSLFSHQDSSFTLGNGVSVGHLSFKNLSPWYNVPESLSLAYNNNYLTFRFVGITQQQSRKVKYQYKLDGMDEHWSALSHRNEAPYGNIPPGKYTFRVRAMNSDGFWSPEFSYAFTIRPPWWKTWWAYVLYALLFILGLRIFSLWRERKLRLEKETLERKVEERTEQLQAEKKKSDDLLLNILPGEVAEELKQKGTADAKQFEDVTVMFTDFKGFTQISEKLSPSELVAEIHTCFKAFDEIISKHNIEKIKTIGDSYMCAGGLPVSNHTHAVDVVQAALEIKAFMTRHLNERKLAGKEDFEMRIGVNTGPVVAGIVGVKKFAYDIWGDTVNTASRMESSGVEGKVNISGATYELVKDRFNCVYRGKVKAKGKGEVDMYFVDDKDVTL